MARTYYSGSNTVTLSTTSSANGLNVSFEPIAARNYAIFHNSLTGFSQASQKNTIRIIAEDVLTVANANTTAPWTLNDLSTGLPPYIFDARDGSTGTGSFTNPGSAGGTWTHSGSGTTLTTRNSVDVYRFNGSGSYTLTGQSAYEGPLTIFTLNERSGTANDAYRTVVNLGNWSSGHDLTNMILYMGVTSSVYAAAGDDVMFSSGYDQGGPDHGALVVNNADTNHDTNLDFKSYYVGASGNRARHNGADRSLTVNNVNPPNDGAYAAGGVYIGRNSAGGEALSGDIALLVVIHGELTTDDYEKLEGYYAHELGLTARLPGGHPYKTDPPVTYIAGGGSEGGGANIAFSTANGAVTSNVWEMFTGGSFNTVTWGVQANGTGNVYTANEQLRLRCRGPTGAGLHTEGPGFYSQGVYNLLSSSVTWEIPLLNSSATIHTGYEFKAGLTSGNSYNTLIWNLYKFGGDMGTECKYNLDQTVGSSYSNWSATTHRWLRIRESGGTYYFDRSSDGSSWTQQASLAKASASAFDPKNAKIYFVCWSYVSDNTNSVYVTLDNINHASQNGVAGPGVNINANGVPITYLTESFDNESGANTTLWLKINEGTTPNLSYKNGRLELLARRATASPRLISKNRYNLQSNSAFVQVPSIGNPGTTQEVEFILNSGSDTAATQNAIKWMINTSANTNRLRLYHNGSLVRENVAGSHGAVTWYRITENAGSLYWYTSTDAEIWTQANTISLASYPSVNVKNVRIEFSASSNTGDSTNPVLFDNFNLSVYLANNEVALYESVMESEVSTDEFWNGGVSIYTAPTPVVANTVIKLQGTTSVGTMTVNDQYITILELTANDYFSVNTSNAGVRSSIGQSGNGHSIYNTAEQIEIPTGDYVIIASAVITDNKSTTSATNNIRMTVFDATENVAFGYIDSSNKENNDDHVPYWYIGTHSLNNTRTYKLLYEAPSTSLANVYSSTILALDQSGFGEVLSAHEDIWGSTTAASFTTGFEYTVTPRFTGNYLVMASWSTGYQGTDSTYSRFTLDNVSYYSTNHSENPTYALTTNGPDGSKFSHGYVGIDALTQTTMTFEIDHYSGTSGQASFMGRKNITAISLGDKNIVTELYVKYNDVWRPTVPYVKKDGSWQQFLPSYKVSGTWRTTDTEEVTYNYAASQNTYFAWDTYSTGATVSYRGSAYGKNTYVLTGHGGLINTSTDGVTWTTRTSGTSSSIYAVTYGDGIFVAGNTGGYTRTSLDAVTWNNGGNGGLSGNNILSLKYLGGKYILTGGYGHICTSTNGSSWTQRHDIPINRDYHDVAYGEGIYVVVGEGGHINTSTDGITWSARTSGTTTELFSVTYGNGIFVATGNNGILGTSTDGTTWSINTTATGTTVSLYQIVYGNGLYVAAGFDGVSKYSTDAVTWNDAPTGQSLHNLSTILYVEGRGEILAAGQAGTLHRSRAKGSFDYSNLFV